MAHDSPVRALGRVRWLLPALVVPAALVALGLVVQALAFERPSPGRLFATQALRELVRFRAMDASERLPSGRVRSVCVEGWFHAPHHRSLHRGALVVLSDGTRMYDLGHGIRSWDGIPAGPLNRRRFLLAGCPRMFDERLAAALVHGAPVTTRAVRDEGAPAFELRLAKSRIGLVVTAGTLRPDEVLLGRGRSDLETAKAAEALAVVDRAFGLLPHRRRAPA
jgi:hypothetical protein